VSLANVIAVGEKNGSGGRVVRVMRFERVCGDELVIDIDWPGQMWGRGPLVCCLWTVISSGCYEERCGS